MKLPVFVESITACPWWNGRDKYDADKPKYEVKFLIQPYFDARERTMSESEPHIQSTQTLSVFYNESPPFSAGEQVALVIE